MTATDAAAVEFFDARALRLEQVPVPRLSSEERAAMDRFWDEAVARQPALFDGPAVACIGVEANDDDAALVLSWAPVTYRYRALRRIEGCSWLPASIFVTVLQPVEGGGLVVGRSADFTVHPGQWALPGGSAEPPTDGKSLDLAALRRHAAQELVEEIGVTADPEDMTVWGVTRGEHGNIGVHFLAPPVPTSLVLKHHEILAEEEHARGAGPELDRLAIVGSVQDLTGLGRCADFLPMVVSRYAGERTQA
ncbi:NUDIX domain-containing protein [Kitasatospora sp. NPDC048365]|uniref:NUDIX domain-containing protein n=1 Tax=Kitasatospora sp. NPDC048365 TaxID=3364050 RepID=UPI0037116B76